MCCACRAGTCASARGSATTCGSGRTMSSISGGGTSPWPKPNVTRLGTVRPVAGLAGVTAAGDVPGVANGGVTGDQACLAGLAGSSACPAGLTGVLATCRGVSCICCSCSCLLTEAPVPVRLGKVAWPSPGPPPYEPTCGGFAGWNRLRNFLFRSVTLRLPSILTQYLPNCLLWPTTTPVRSHMGT